MTFEESQRAEFDEVAEKLTDAQLFTAVSQTDPGIVRTISLLITELDAATLSPDVQRQLGAHLRQIGDTLVKRADRVIVELP